MEEPRTKPERERVIGITVLALLVFVLAFLPWGELRVTQRLFDGPLLGGTLRMDLAPVVTLDGWNGHVTVLGVELPNAIVVLAALAVALLCWLERTAPLSAPAWLLVVLVAYGIGHTARVVLALSKAAEATVGAGSVLTLACWIGMAVVLVRTRTRRERDLTAGERARPPRG
jgi:hypothetical protein